MKTYELVGSSAATTLTLAGSARTCAAMWSAVRSRVGWLTRRTSAGWMRITRSTSGWRCAQWIPSTTQSPIELNPMSFSSTALSQRMLQNITTSGRPASSRSSLPDPGEVLDALAPEVVEGPSTLASLPEVGVDGLGLIGGQRHLARLIPGLLRAPSGSRPASPGVSTMLSWMNPFS